MHSPLFLWWSHLLLNRWLIGPNITVDLRFNNGWTSQIWGKVSGIALLMAIIFLSSSFGTHKLHIIIFFFLSIVFIFLQSSPPSSYFNYTASESIFFPFFYDLNHNLDSICYFNSNIFLFTYYSIYVSIFRIVIQTLLFFLDSRSFVRSLYSLFSIFKKTKKKQRKRAPIVILWYSASIRLQWSKSFRLPITLTLFLRLLCKTLESWFHIMSFGQISAYLLRFCLNT